MNVQDIEKILVREINIDDGILYGYRTAAEEIHKRLQPPTPLPVEQAAESYASDKCRACNERGFYGPCECRQLESAFIAGHSHKGEGWVNVTGMDDEENIILNFICRLFGLTYKPSYKENGACYEASLRDKEDEWVINANDCRRKKKFRLL